MKTKLHAIHAIMDIIRFGLDRLPQIEYLALLFFAERTFDEDKESIICSMLQMTNGMRTPDGEEIRGSSGLCKRSCLFAIRGLLAKGLITRTRRRGGINGTGSTLASEYTLNRDAIHAFLCAPAPISLKSWRPEKNRVRYQLQ